MTMIDMTKPIELVDGTPCSNVRRSGMGDAIALDLPPSHGSDHKGRVFNYDGTHVYKTLPNIRNVVADERTYMTRKLHHRARVIATDVGGAYPVAVVVTLSNGDEQVHMYNSDLTHQLSSWDLIPFVAPVKEVILPFVLSELITIALKDLKAVEQNPAYRVDMSHFHRVYDTRCSVCFAGAVMAQTLNVPYDAETFPDDFPNNNRQLRALDAIRIGAIDTALLHHLQLIVPTNIPRCIPVNRYRDNPKLFKRQMKFISELLALNGL